MALEGEMQTERQTKRERQTQREVSQTLVFAIEIIIHLQIINSDSSYL